LNGLWYYSNDGREQQGPVSKEDLQQLAKEGLVGKETPVWTSSLPAWSTFGKCFPPLIDSPPVLEPNGKIWYYSSRQGDRFGPNTYTEIQSFIHCGRMFRNDLVWATHLPEWMPIDQVPEFKNLITQLPPVLLGVNSQESSQKTIDTIKNLELASAIVWSVIAGVQIFGAIISFAIPFIDFSMGGVALLFVGVWNIFAAVSRFGLTKRIQERRSSVINTYQGVTQLIVIGLINLVFGAIIGALWVIIDFIIRDMVLKNKHLFNQ